MFDRRLLAPVAGEVGESPEVRRGRELPDGGSEVLKCDRSFRMVGDFAPAVDEFEFGPDAVEKLDRERVALLFEGDLQQFVIELLLDPAAGKAELGCAHAVGVLRFDGALVIVFAVESGILLQTRLLLPVGIVAMPLQIGGRREIVGAVEFRPPVEVDQPAVLLHFKGVAHFACGEQEAASGTVDKDAHDFRSL